MLWLVFAMGAMPPRELCQLLRFDYPDEAEVAAALAREEPLDELCSGAMSTSTLDLLDRKKGASSKGKRGITAVHVVFPPLLFAKILGGGGPSGELPGISWTLIHQGSRHLPALLEAGADPNRLDEFGIPPLFYALDAAQDGDPEAVEILLEAGADPSLMPRLSPEGLLLAAQYPELLEAACPEEFWGRGREALRKAVWRQDGVALAGLASCPGASPGALGRTLTLALDYGQLDLVQELLVQEASLEAALDEAAWRGSWELMPVLVEWGADPDGVDNTIPLETALERGRERAAEQLVELGAEVDLVRYERSLLTRTAGQGHDEGVAFLLEHGADPALGDPLHHTLDRWEFEPGHARSAVLLLERGAPITPEVELWADEHFSCGVVATSLVDQGLEVTTSRLDQLMYMCPEEDFRALSEHATSWSLRTVRRQNRHASNAAVVTEILRERRAER